MNVITQQQDTATPVKTEVAPRVFLWQVGFISLSVLAFMTAIALSIAPRYETIDDIVMHEYVAGLFCAFKPDDHMIYTHVLLGKLLAGLYSAAANVPWYPLYQMVALFASSTVICATFVKLYGSRGAIVPSLIYAFAMLAPSIICMQFTTTASLVGIAGGVLLFSAIESRADSKWRWWLASGGTFAFGFAFLMRQKAGWMITVLFALYAVARYFRKSWRNLGIALGVTAALACLCQVLWFANDTYYKRTGWGEFEVWRRKLHPLYDFSRLNLRSRAAVATIKTVGWSRNDVKMLNTCMHWDDDVFSSAKLNSLIERGHRWIRADVETYLPGAFSRLVKNPQAQIVFFLLLSSLLIAASRRLSNLRFAALFFGVAAVATVITATHKYSLHVYLPMLYMLAVARLTALKFNWPSSTDESSSASSSALPDSGRKNSAEATELAYALLLLFGCIGFFVYSLADHNARLTKAVNSAAVRRNDLKIIHERFPDKLAYTVVGAPALLPFENTEPFKDLKVVSSYTSRMSFGKELLAMHQIKGFGEGFLSGKVMVLSNPKQNKALETFFREHYNVNLKFKLLPTGGLGIYEPVVVDGNSPDRLNKPESGSIIGN